MNVNNIKLFSTSLCIRSVRKFDSEVPSSFRYVSVVCYTSAVGNVMTLLTGEIADCEGSDQKCCRVG